MVETKTNHYYSENQSSAYNPFLISIFARGFSYDLYSASGVFSLKHLDKGTEILLKYLDVSFFVESKDKKCKVLDLGCGYGVVGITLLKEFPTLCVTFSDSSKRATMLTKKNLLHLHLNGLVVQSNGFEKIENQDFDAIITNPPYAAGRDVCFSFIEGALIYLKIGGCLQLVCRRNKGGDVLEKKMKDVFGNVCVVGQKSGFRVYKSVKE